MLAVGLAGARLERGELFRLEALAPAGVILFARNSDSPGQVMRLTRSIREAIDAPLVLVVQEGGRVDRLRSWRGRSPSARELAKDGHAAVAAEASAVAAELRQLGINFNCVPEVDLDEGNEGNGIGDRSFSSDPVEVAALARAVVVAHRRENVAST
jgi:beta-N-acetylhexosaminidase